MSTAHQLTEQLLRSNPMARDDDRVFLIEYLSYLGINLNMFELDKIKNGFAWETLTRERRVIQNNEKRLQATETVQKKRKTREVEMHTKYLNKASNRNVEPSIIKKTPIRYEFRGNTAYPVYQ